MTTTDALRELRELVGRLYESEHSWSTSGFRVLCADIFQAVRDFPVAAPVAAAPAPAIERLLCDARQAMIDYGQALKRDDQDGIRDSTTRATNALGALASPAPAPAAVPAPEPSPTRAELLDLLKDWVGDSLGNTGNELLDASVQAVALAELEGASPAPAVSPYGRAIESYSKPWPMEQAAPAPEAEPDNRSGRYSADTSDTGTNASLPERAEGAIGAVGVTPPAELLKIAALLHTQDNRITQDPLFAVQQKRRIYGIDEGYCDTAEWVLEGETWTPENGEDPPAEARKVGYIDTWEFVTGCFTEQGCKDYIACNGHNLHEPRIYAYGSYRNAEFIAIRKWLMSLAATKDSQ